MREAARAEMFATIGDDLNLSIAIATAVVATLLFLVLRGRSSDGIPGPVFVLPLIVGAEPMQQLLPNLISSPSIADTDAAHPGGDTRLLCRPDHLPVSP